MGEKLNIGAGVTYIPGFRNIDISDRAEICLDLNTDPLPFSDNSVELIFSYHTLEHVQSYLKALAEIHRVLVHGGIFYLGVPYLTLTKYNLVNPYHHVHFNEYSFDFFDPKRMKGSAAEINPIMFKKIFHRFDYKSPFSRMPRSLQNICRRHLFNVVTKIDFGLVALKDAGLSIPAIDPKLHEAAFDRILSQRVCYPENEHDEAATGGAPASLAS
jgi:SAM-dependent methyltransferase